MVDELSKHYSAGVWKGLPQWRCLVCQWDTLESEAAMQEHVQTMHLPKITVLQVKGQILDRFGNPMVREVVEVRDAPVPIIIIEEVDDGKTEPHAADGVGDEN